MRICLLFWSYDACLMFIHELLWHLKASYPPTHYIRTVPQRTIHLFTCVQLIQLLVLCCVAFSGIAYLQLAFPLLLILLLPMRSVRKVKSSWKVVRSILKNLIWLLGRVIQGALAILPYVCNWMDWNRFKWNETDWNGLKWTTLHLVGAICNYK